MKRVSLFALVVPLLGSFMLFAPDANAFCGVIQETAQSMNGYKAARKADRQADRQVRSLRKQYKKKLALDKRTAECVGGAVAIDANGNQIVGPSRCTVTQGFCVNP